MQNKALEKRTALLELEQKAGVAQTAVQEQMKADLEKARQELAKVTSALTEAQNRGEAARLKKEEAEKRAAQLEQAGKSKDAEKARAEAAESNLAMLAEKAKSEAARRQQVEAENLELQKRMAMLEVKANEALKGNDAAIKLQKELEQARDEVRIARQLTQASEARSEAAKLAVSEAETRQQTAERQAQAVLAKINENTKDPEAHKEIARLQAEAEKYKKLLEQATKDRLFADISANSFEDELASSEVEYNKKWSRPLGKRPTRKMRLKDLLQIDEAKELPELPPGPAPDPASTPK